MEGETGMIPRTSSALNLRLTGASIVFSLTAFCSPVFASETGCSATASQPRAGNYRAGQVVSVDPDSGELTRARMPEGAKLPERDVTPVNTWELADGTVVADVGDRFRSHLVAEMVDGKLVTCHQMVETPPDTVDSHEVKDR